MVYINSSLLQPEARGNKTRLSPPRAKKAFMYVRVCWWSAAKRKQLHLVKSCQTTPSQDGAGSHLTVAPHLQIYIWKVLSGGCELPRERLQVPVPPTCTCTCPSLLRPRADACWERTPCRRQRGDFERRVGEKRELMDNDKEPSAGQCG